MRLDTLTPLDQETLAETRAILRGMRDRLGEILAAPELTEDTFVEVAAIYDNAAYVFLYLESNEEHVDHSALLPFRQAFFGDEELDRRLLDLCGRLRCADPEVAVCLDAYVRHLTERLAADHDRAAELDQLQQRAKEIVSAGQRDQLALLSRLGVEPGTGTPETASYALISATPDAARRSKLSAAMTALRDKRLGDLVETVDQLVATRQEISRAAGFPSALAQTMSRCDLSEQDARSLVDGYVAAAVARHESLLDDIRAALGDLDSPIDHFGHYVRQLQRGVVVPLFDLHHCLDFVYQVVARTFGLDMRPVADSGPHVLTVAVRRGDEVVGYVNFDLWDSGRDRAANSTSGIRGRVEWGEVVQLPIAYVSCRFHRRPGGRELITFQNVHSLFHETGHAINHILLRKRLPTVSGLDYVPLERIEDLSMWTEKWVYHPDFVDHLGLSEPELAGVAFCQRVKVLEYRRTHVDRAVTAALDFEVHSGAAGGLRGAFQRLDDRFGVAAHCSLGDFPVYFSRPMINANPGATFAYTRSFAASAEQFGPIMDRHLADLDPAEFDGAFDACFDYDEPSSKPDIESMFTFYDDVLRRLGR
ncbi:oligopeptidase A [Actinokineospora baliensis]|uniref:M3 family metallopeptidase n=1 Tax=Actinokineospora baliensis TaxID=547056 RepID=UPI00195A1F21|nr:M3 family metallopeptidase [Actinokineospora baliensis]MBM7771680.1 oligopeptidase A [Actinokineospora baliensis]